MMRDPEFKFPDAAGNHKRIEAVAPQTVSTSPALGSGKPFASVRIPAYAI